MSKKILLSLLALVVVAGGMAALSAYEAHVINVTAHIENALSVDAYEIDFGTVFPQEYVEKYFTISLSDSFLKEDRVDDVDYIIAQKPKCKIWSVQDPTVCKVYYENLCSFLSKLNIEEDEDEGDFENDDDADSYYQEGGVGVCSPPDKPCCIGPDEASGRLAKSEFDTEDSWTIDLKVPPIKGTVGQDWPEDCPIIDFEADYGCDLWVEVTGISSSLSLPWVNEIHYDNEGADENEGLEIAGQAGVDLTDWTVVFYNGSNGLSYGTLNLSGTIPNQQSNYGTLWFYFVGFQNGAPDGFALVNPANQVVQFLSYEGSFMAMDGPANTMLSVDIGAAEEPMPPVDFSLQLQGIGNEYADFIWAGPIEQTYGNVNTNQTFN